MEGIYAGPAGTGDNEPPNALFLHIAYDTLLEITQRGIVVGV